MVSLVAESKSKYLQICLFSLYNLAIHTKKSKVKSQDHFLWPRDIETQIWVLATLYFFLNSILNLMKNLLALKLFPKSMCSDSNFCPGGQRKWPLPTNLV